MYHRMSTVSSLPIPCCNNALSAPFRRALSTGGLLLEEEPGAGAGAVRRYTAAERRESIQRYRSKRKRRNFQKKITYACRKTLAESRRRIKGRFAHTGDGDGDGEGDGDQLYPRATHQPAEVNYNDKILSKAKDEVVDVSESSSVPEWWPAMEEALAREVEQEEDLHLFDGDMLTSCLGCSARH